MSMHSAITILKIKIVNRYKCLYVDQHTAMLTTAEHYGAGKCHISRESEEYLTQKLENTHDLR